MREIKFRAWWQHQNRWLEEAEIRRELVMVASGKEVKLLALIDIYVMQYTGLKDKNGKEIYEGDIIQISDDRGLTPSEVIFENSQFIAKRSVHTLAYDCKGHFVEVIGNIYENPQLTKPNKEKQ